MPADSRQFGGRNTPPPTGRVQVKLEDLPPVQCPDCGGIYFDEAKVIRALSKLHTGEAKDGIIPDIVLRCLGCNTFLDGTELMKAVEKAINPNGIIGG